MTRSRKRPYTGARRYCMSCRNHGGCPWCERGRLHNDRKRRQAADEQLEDADSPVPPPGP